MSQYSVVILSPEVPKPEPTSAGERLIRELYLTLVDLGHRPIFMAPRPRQAFEGQYDVEHYFLPEPSALLARLDRLKARFNTWMPSLGILQVLNSDPQARRLLAQASIIDLQWSSIAALAPALARINPSAQLLATFHDVNQQRMDRRSQQESKDFKGQLKALTWTLQGKGSAFLDRLAGRYLDQALVLSEKDRKLLPLRPHDRPKIKVLAPPVYIDQQKVLPPKTEGKEILFVGTMYRWENHQAMIWFIREVLPKVWKEHPLATLKIAGAGALDELVSTAAQDQRIELLGFVDDLEPVYARASLAVAPIHLGSGVKFKTLDALLRGLPLVSTWAGMEGVGKNSWAAAVTNLPQVFAEAVNQVLANPAPYRSQAASSRIEAVNYYSSAAYRRRVQEVYGAPQA